MIKGVKELFNGFKERNGLSILSATVIGRVLSFFASWIALQLIDHSKLGVVIYAFTIVSFIIPIAGLGLHQSLIRYGALLKTENEKKSLFVYVLKKGMFWSFILVFITILLSYIFNDFLPESQFYIIILSFVIPTTFLLEIIKIQFRLYHKNNLFASADITYNVLLVIAVSVLSYRYKEIGYAIALVATPLLVSLFFLKTLRINFSKKIELTILDFTFWKYGFFASLSNVATQLLSAIDILLIGYLITETSMVTIYKYVALVPLSLLFLPRVFLTTDFVAITERIYDKNYIKNYIKNYLLIFIPISVFIGLLSLAFAKNILLFFGSDFSSYSSSFTVLIIGILGILILRGLFGNLLSAIGKAYINYWIAFSAILLNVVSNYYLIPKYGIFGAALTSAMLMWLTGIVSCLLFFWMYQNLKKAA
tara:strand:+ start:52476 stop:53741 length:1266 start_codon:yes stop_codon:yes gene_type:complete